MLQRPYPKGRDFYDLLWYLSDPAWPSPNLVLLNNALRQTGWTVAELTGESWRELVRERIEGVDWGRIIGDVGPFLEDSAEIDLLTLENLSRLLTVPSA